MDVSLTEERAGRIEALFREVNEHVRRLADPGDPSQPEGDFICECSQDTCMERVHVPLATYEAVRGHPRRFIILPGHENDFEHVVERDDSLLIVEKEGTAGRVAEHSDPRSEPGPPPGHTKVARPCKTRITAMGGRLEGFPSSLGASGRL